MGVILAFIAFITYSIGTKIDIFFKKDIYVKIFFYVISITSLIFSILYFFGILDSPYRNYLDK